MLIYFCIIGLSWIVGFPLAKGLWDQKILPGVVTRYEVEAEGQNVGRIDHEGTIWRFQRLQAYGNPIPVGGISDQIIDIRPPQLER